MDETRIDYLTTLADSLILNRGAITFRTGGRYLAGYRVRRVNPLVYEGRHFVAESMREPCSYTLALGTAREAVEFIAQMESPRGDTVRKVAQNRPVTRNP